MNRLQTVYQQQIVPTLRQELKLANPHQLPKLEKVVLNVGAGRAASDSRLLETATNTLRKISGQQPVVTRARSSIAGFKLREGQPIGLKVTLRGARMYEFLDRLVSIVLPRMRDFRGLPTGAFDGSGNYSIGLREQTVFPELTYEDTALTHGLQVNIVTNAATEKSRILLQAFGFPFERSK